MSHSEKLHVLHADTTARRQQEHPIMLKLVNTAISYWRAQDPRLCSVGGEDACEERREWESSKVEVGGTSSTNSD